MKRIFLFLMLMPFLAIGQKTVIQLQTQNNSQIKNMGTSQLRSFKMYDSLIQSTPNLLGSYANPSWITSLANTKITGLGSLATLNAINPTANITGWPANSSGALTNNGSGVLSWVNYVTSASPPTTGAFFLRGNGSGGFTNLVSPSDGQLIRKVAGPDYDNSGISSDGTTATFGAVPNLPSQTTNKFFASPNGSSGVPSFRAIVAADIPTLNQNTSGSAATLSPGRNINGVLFDGSGNISVNLNNALSVDNSSLQLNSGTTFDGSAVRTISVKAGGVTNAMLAGSISDGNLATSYIKADGTRAFTGDQSLGGFKVTNVKELDITGTAGAGFVNLISQSSNPSQPSGSVSIFSNSGNHLSWMTPSDAFSRTLSAGTLTANRTYTLRDFSGSFLIDNGTNTLSGATTITSNAGNGLLFNGTWTASANNQYGIKIDQTITSRVNSGDAVVGNYFNTTFNINSTSIDAAGAVFDYNPIQQGGITATNNTTNGNTCAGMTITTYTGVAPASTTGSGTGALFTVIVNSATTFTSITVTTPGSGYKVGDQITFNGSQFGSGSGSNILVITGVSGQTLGTKASVLRLINRSPSSFGGSTWNYINFEEGTGEVIGSIRAHGGAGGRSIALFAGTGSTVFSTDGATLTIPINVSMTSTASLGSVSTTSGTFTSFVTSSAVSTGSGSTFDNTNSAFHHSGNKSGSLVVNNSVFGSFTAKPTISTGLVNTLGAITGGSGYTNGTYNSVASTGGTGSGLNINVTVSGGAVTAVTVSSRGTGYAVGDVISAPAASIGGTGSGFSVPVSTIDFSEVLVAGYTYVPSQSGASSANSFYGFYGKPTYNLTGAFTGKIAGIWWDPTVTSNTGTSYSFVATQASTLGGTGTSSPLSSWDVNGSEGNAIATSTGNLTLDATNYTVIITSGTGTYTLPAASGATRRIYVFVNQTGSGRTISTYKDKTGSSATTIAANSSLVIQSDGSNWYQTN